MIFIKKTLKFMWRFCQEVISQTSQIGCRTVRFVGILLFKLSTCNLEENFCNLKTVPQQFHILGKNRVPTSDVAD